MAQISNDQDLRAALEQLPLEQQRRLAGRFVQSVIHLTQDSRLIRAVDSALAADTSPDDLEEAHKAAKSHAIRTYTACGKDTDWLAQADHFVAAAAAAALLPEGQHEEKASRAWKAAVQARMAKNCELMESEEGEKETEAERQYRIAEGFLAGGS